MATTISADWKAQAIAAYQERQAQLQAQDQQRHTDLIQALGEALHAMGIPAEPTEYPATVDGVLFKLWDEEYQYLLQARRVCTVCGAEHWETIQNAIDLGRALVEPWQCWFGDHHTSQEPPKAADPATVLVEALRAFIASEQGDRDA